MEIELTDSLELTKNKVMVENNAQAIFDHLRLLENDLKNRSRWIWELMQNAQDAAGEIPVDIVVSFDNREVTFTHNGLAFSEEDITHLIFHGSSKKEMEGKTGKFGTGFMTTHLLSKLVKIEGMIAENKSFSFVLDRTGNNHAEMTESLNKSWNEFKTSTKQTNSNLTTSFKYLNLTEDALKAINEVLEKAEQLVPLVLTFSTKIRSLKTVYSGNEFLYKKDESANSRTKISVTKNGIFYKRLHFVFRALPEDTGIIALPVDEFNSVLEIEASLPRLFITFPLIGTEKAFPLPFFIHSPNFEPSPERERIWLTVDTAESKSNKCILEKAFRQYLELAKSLVTSYPTANLSVLANLGHLPQVEWLDRNWYEQQLVFLMQAVDLLPIIKTIQSETKISIDEASIPFGVNGIEELNDIWDLTSKLLPRQCPENSSLTFWVEIIKNKNTFGPQHKCAFTFETICQIISALPSHSLQELDTKVDNSIILISELIRCLEKYKKEQFWRDYQILPSQEGILKKAVELKQESTENEIGNELKDVSHNLGDVVKSRLLHRDININSEDSRLTIESKSDVIPRLLDIIKNKRKDEPDEIWIKGSTDMLKWLLENNRINDLTGFPVKMHSGKWDKIQQAKENIFLCPVAIWRDSFIPYHELFPGDFILSDIYTNIFGATVTLEKAITAGLVLKDPLYYKSEELKGSKIPLMVTRRVDKENIGKLENAEWKMTNNIQFSQLAYIDYPEDKGIIDKVRNSRKRTLQFLKFITDVLIKEDSYGFTRKSINITPSTEPKNIEVGIYPSLWLLKIKDRDWVRVTGTTSERPTVESLMSYFKKDEDQDLYQTLKRDDVSRFLHFLGIGVGDLLRNIRSGDNEEDRMSWDQSYVTILMNENLTPQKVTSMLSDADFIRQYEEKKELEKKIQQNQEIGGKVEKAFNEAVTQQKGYTVIRQPIGQDFEVECDFIHRLLLQKNDGKRQNFLIEIKSARTSEVKMTVTQGFTACTTSEKYILCVVPVGSEEITSDLVKKNARFITNISELLETRVSQINSLTRLQTEATNSSAENSDPVRTMIEGTQIRYAIQEKAWKNSPPTCLSFEEFITGLD